MNKIEDIKFPVYRRYKNGKHLFKIMSLEAFEEIQFIGTKAIVHTKKASILPDRNFIYDLCFNYSDFADVCFEEDYLLIINNL